MISKRLKELATNLRSNPSYLEEMDESGLWDVLYDYVFDESKPDDDVMESLLQEHPRARQILESLRETRVSESTAEGQASIENLVGRLMPPLDEATVERKSGKTLDSLIDSWAQAVSSAISTLFSEIPTYATASSESRFKRKVDDKTSVEVEEDAEGNHILRVTTMESGVQGRRFTFEIENTPPVLKFEEIDSGVYAATSVIDAETKKALIGGVLNLKLIEGE